VKNTNALAKEEHWKNEQAETAVTDLDLVPSTAMKMTTRVAGPLNFLLSAAVPVAQGGRGVWRMLFAHSTLVVIRGPHGEKVALSEEFPHLQQDQVFTAFLR
jgi:hypothetical protein